MPMNIVVCVKEVFDPDAVDNYALAGKLEIEADGKTLVRKSIPRLMNAYDEQAIECALRLRDAGVDCKIHVVSLGADPTKILQHAVAMGADEVAMIPVDTASVDGHATASLLAAFVKSIGGADLVLCGRQASDVDQGVVPALVAETLGMPVVTVAREVKRTDGGGLRVIRATNDGDEVVEVDCPVVVTISNELGDPRYPTGIRTVKAQRVKPRQVSVEELGIGGDAGRPRWMMIRQSVETITGSCEFIEGDSSAAKARALVERLRADGAIE